MNRPFNSNTTGTWSEGNPESVALQSGRTSYASIALPTCDREANCALQSSIPPPVLLHARCLARDCSNYHFAATSCRTAKNRAQLCSTLLGPCAPPSGRCGPLCGPTHALRPAGSHATSHWRFLDCLRTSFGNSHQTRFFGLVRHRLMRRVCRHECLIPLRRHRRRHRATPCGSTSITSVLAKASTTTTTRTCS